MADITINWKDGTHEYLEDHGAPGGSYSQTYTVKEGFVVIKNAYGEQRIIPAENIREIQYHQRRPLY